MQSRWSGMMRLHSTITSPYARKVRVMQGAIPYAVQPRSRREGVRPDVRHERAAP